jgi:hypothetical protein
VGDISVICQAAASFARGAARTPGFQLLSGTSLATAYRQVSSALPFVPMLVGTSPISLLCRDGDQAVAADEEVQESRMAEVTVGEVPVAARM